MAKNILSESVRKTRVKEINDYALTGKVNDKIGDCEMEALQELGSVLYPAGIDLPKDDIGIRQQAIRTIEDLKDSVITVLEEGLRDEKVKYMVALGIAKYVFPQLKASTNKNDNNIKVVFENIQTDKRQTELTLTRNSPTTLSSNSPEIVNLIEKNNT